MQNTKEGLTLIKNETEEYYVDSQGRKQGEYFTSEGYICMKCNYVDDEIDGEYILYYYYYDTDIISVKSNFSKGLHHGEYISYYESRRKRLEGIYVNDKKEGYWLKYKDEENSIPEIIYYEDDQECDPPSVDVKNARKKI